MNTAQRSTSHLSLILILVAVSAINPIAVNMFVPAMPTMMLDLGTNQAMIQLVLSGYLFATAMAQLVLGPLSDKVGRRPVLLGGLVVFVVSSAICATATSLAPLVAARVFQGAGGCVGIVVGRAIIRDRFDRSEAASMIGYVTMGFATAPMVGPIIGGLLNDNVGWQSIFLLLTGLGLAVGLVAFVLLPETHEPAKRLEARPGLWRSFVTLSRIPAFWAYALTCAFGTSVFFAFLGGTPLVASELLGLSGTEYGLYFVFVPGGFIIGNYLTARYSQRIGIRPMLIGGSAIALVAVLGMAAAFLAGWYHPLSLFIPMYAIGFANGLTLANSIAGAVSVRPEIAGAASGITGSLQIGSGAVATVIIGAVLAATQSVFPLTIGMALFAAAGLGAAIWTRSAHG